MSSQEHTEATHYMFVEGLGSLNSLKYKKFNKVK